MPVARSVDNPHFQLNGNTVTGLVSPSRGANECILYRVEFPPGGSIPAHRHDHEDVFTVVEGGATIHIDEDSDELGPNDSVVVPTGALHGIVAGSQGCAIVVTMLAGTLFIREDGTSAVPAWGI
jgi:quercetin dioxygenase-like cupin family protein